MIVTEPLPQSVLFCCDHNAVRSPMAEGIMKKFFGPETYVQSAGVMNDMEIDGFSIAVCEEIGVELARHRSRSFDEMGLHGDDLSSFDLIVALSPRSAEHARDLTRAFATEVVFWPIPDPTGQGETRAARLEAYRAVRDAIIGHLTARWGDPRAA